MKRMGFILVGLSLLVLAGAALGVGHEVGHVSEGYDPNLGVLARLLSEGDVSPLPADDERLGKPISLEGSWEILGGFYAWGGIDPISTGYLSGVTGATQLLAYNLANQCWDPAPTGGLTEGDFPFAIEDQGPYDADDGLGVVSAYFIAVKPYSEPTPGGGGGGGCSAAFLAPASLLLLAPLFMLRRRG